MSSVVDVCWSIEMWEVFTSHCLLLLAIAFVSLLLLAYLFLLATTGAVICLFFGWGDAPRIVPLLTQLYGRLGAVTGSLRWCDVG